MKNIEKQQKQVKNGIRLAGSVVVPKRSPSLPQHSTGGLTQRRGRPRPPSAERKSEALAHELPSRLWGRKKPCAAPYGSLLQQGKNVFSFFWEAGIFQNFKLFENLILSMVWCFYCFLMCLLHCVYKSYVFYLHHFLVLHCFLCLTSVLKEIGTKVR